MFKSYGIKGVEDSSSVTNIQLLWSWKNVLKRFITDVKQLRCLKIAYYFFLNQQRSC